MRLIQYLIESEGNRYSQDWNQFVSDFRRDNPGERTPTTNEVLGQMNRRSHKPGQDVTLDYVTDWFTQKGYLQRKGSMVVPTERGSKFRQVVAAKPGNGSSDLSRASNNFKDLRKYFMGVTDEVTREYLETLDEPTLKALATARELEQEDIAILNGIRDKAENHRERSQYVMAMRDKNPERLDRLIELGFIDSKTGAFNKSRWDAFVSTISALDPARIKTLVPKFYEWSTHSSGNVAKNINRILFAIHPQSRNRTPKGEMVWRQLKNLPPDYISALQAGKKPKQGELSDEAYNLLTTVVASVVRTFPEVKTSEELLKALDDAFDSRVDFKSLDRSGDKTASRRQGVEQTFQAK